MHLKSILDWILVIFTRFLFFNIQNVTLYLCSLIFSSKCTCLFLENLEDHLLNYKGYTSRSNLPIAFELQNICKQNFQKSKPQSCSRTKTWIYKKKEDEKLHFRDFWMNLRLSIVLYLNAWSLGYIHTECSRGC